MDNEMIAYVDGDYQQTADFVPSIVFAAWWDETITNLSDSFIVDKGTFNYPYDIEWVITQTATGISELTSEEWVVIPKFYWYYSCLEIYENGHSMWSGSYTILQSDGMTTSTWCSMNY
jgi:nucleoside-specific outer membrane channel protein Tsx